MSINSLAELDDLANFADPLGHLDKNGKSIEHRPLRGINHFWRCISSPKVYAAYQGHLKLIKAGNAIHPDPLVENQPFPPFSADEYRKEGSKALLKFVGLNKNEVELAHKYMDMIFASGKEVKKEAPLNYKESIPFSDFVRYFFPKRELTENENYMYQKFNGLATFFGKNLETAVFNLREKISQNISGDKSSSADLEEAKTVFKKNVLEFLTKAANLGLPGVERSMEEKLKLKIRMIEEESQIKKIWNKLFKQKNKSESKIIVRSSIRC